MEEAIYVNVDGTVKVREDGQDPKTLFMSQRVASSNWVIPLEVATASQ